MPKYKVNFVKHIFLSYEVEAENEEEAIEIATDNALSICAPCGGWGHPYYIEDGDPWLLTSEFHQKKYDPEFHGKDVELCDESTD